MSARAKGRPSADPRQVGLILGLQPVESPAEALARRVMRTLHDALNGCIEKVSGDRHPEYFRQILSNDRCCSLQRDLCQLAVRPEREPRLAVRAVCLLLLAETELQAGESLELEAAAFAEESADVPAEVLRRSRDGVIDEADAAAIAHELDQVDQRAMRLRAALPARRTA